MSLTIDKQLLTPNKYSRPQSKLQSVKKIVVHWVGNAGSRGISNRNYFESLKSGEKGIYASAHYIIGLDGEIILCVPENEIAYHANSANSYSIGIENCHPDWGGKFNDKTMPSLIQLCADICKRYNLNPLDDIIRHYDVTKKDCPHYYISHVPEWLAFKQNVKDAMNPSDDVLVSAVKKLNKVGADIDEKIWGNLSSMKTQYGEALITKVGRALFKNPTMTYTQVIDKLISDKKINSPTIWNSKSYKPTHLRSIIIVLSDYAK